MHKLSPLAAVLLLAACGGGSGSGGAGPIQAAPSEPQPAAAPTVAMALVGDDIVAQWPQAQLPAGAVKVSLGAAIGMRPAVLVLQGDLVVDMIGQAQSSGACVVVVSVLPSNSHDDLATMNEARWQATYAYGAQFADAYTGLVEPPVDVATRLLDPTLPPDSHALRADMDAGDGRHLTAAGYQELGEAISKAMHGCAL